MRRFRSTLVVLLLAATACSDDGGATTADPTTTSSTTTSTPAPTTTGAAPEADPTTTTTTSTVPSPSSTTAPPEWPGESFGASPPPDMLVTDGTIVMLVRAGADDPDDWLTEALTTANPVVEIRMTNDGSFVTEEQLEPGPDLEPITEVARYDPDGVRTVVAGSSRLFDVATVGGFESMIVDIGVDEELGSGGLAAIPLDGDGPPIDLGRSTEAEFGVTHVDWASGLGVVTAWADLTESIGYRSVDGDVELPTPSEELPYNSPPYLTAATLSPSGRIVYWAEGPDWGLDLVTNESGPIPGEWRVKSMDLVTGEMLLDQAVSEEVADTAELSISSLHFTGNHLLINRATLIYDEWEDLRPLVLDFGTEEPDLYELPIIGFATPSA